MEGPLRRSLGSLAQQHLAAVHPVIRVRPEHQDLLGGIAREAIKRDHNPLSNIFLDLWTHTQLLVSQKASDFRTAHISLSVRIGNLDLVPNLELNHRVSSSAPRCDGIARSPVIKPTSPRSK